MAKYLYLVETSCKDPKREKEFNEWYDKVHVPDIAETPGLVKVNRYKLDKPAAGKSQYLSVYEIEAESFDAWTAGVGETMKRVGPERAFNATLASVDSKAVYRKISSPFPKK